MVFPTGIDSPIDKLLKISFKVSEAAHFAAKYIFDDERNIVDLEDEEKDELNYFLISYIGEFLALLEADRTIIYDEITYYQMTKYPDYEMMIDGAQVDLILHKQQLKQNEKGEEKNPSGSLYS